MPPLPAADKVIKIVCSGSNEDTPFINIFYALYTGGPAVITDLTSLHAATRTEIEAMYANYCRTAVSLDTITYTDLSTDTSPTFVGTVDVAGTLTGAALPASAAMVCRCEIARRYRGGHPRKYFPIGDVTKLASGTNNMWDPTFSSDVESTFGTYIGNLSAYSGGTLTSLTAVNLSYVSGGSRRATPVTDPIISTSIAPRLCSQRRRLGRPGS